MRSINLNWKQPNARLQFLPHLTECHTYVKKRCTKNLGFQGQRFSLNFNLLLD